MGAAAIERPWLSQAEWSVRFEWGPTGVHLVPAEAVVVVDVLRFTTAVDAGVSRGATVFPYRWKDESMHRYALEINAAVAEPGAESGPSLSPVSLLELEPGDRVVLPSPNGSTCASVAHDAGAFVYAACLRNAAAVGRYVGEHHASVTVIACGERWPDGSLRPSIEDGLGAGAVLAGLRGGLSPEATAAAEAWGMTGDRVAERVAASVSGREAIARGWRQDVDFACEINVSDAVPALRQGGFVDASRDS